MDIGVALGILGIFVTVVVAVWGLKKVSKLFNVWDNLDLKHISLTSVGITIGHANSRDSDDQLRELSDWIT